MSADVKVTVVTRYLEGQSSPEQKQFVFAYSIDIENRSESPVQLLTREWTISDADGKTTHVAGDGVVGQQPWIQPGEVFSYTSGTVLTTPLGSMEGQYGLIDEQGRPFDIPIPAFSLALPNMLH